MTSLQDGSEDPLFLFADLFEDGIADDSMTTNAAASVRGTQINLGLPPETLNKSNAFDQDTETSLQTIS